MVDQVAGFDGRKVRVEDIERDWSSRRGRRLQGGNGMRDSSREQHIEGQEG